MRNTREQGGRLVCIAAEDPAEEKCVSRNSKLLGMVLTHEGRGGGV